jgi:hypothetical protein
MVPIETAAATATATDTQNMPISKGMRIERGHQNGAPARKADFEIQAKSQEQVSRLNGRQQVERSLGTESIFDYGGGEYWERVRGR